MRAAGSYLRRLRSPPVVDVAHLVHATDGAVRRATLLGQELTLHVRPAVLSQWNARIATLWRAVMHQPELADVEITRTRATAPFVRLPFRDAVLKPIEARVILVPQLLHIVEDLLFRLAQWLERAVSVMDHTNSG